MRRYGVADAGILQHEPEGAACTRDEDDHAGRFQRGADSFEDRAETNPLLAHQERDGEKTADDERNVAVPGELHKRIEAWVATLQRVDCFKSRSDLDKEDWYNYRYEREES